ncbi:MAG TPA: hypothetical protein VM681_08650 [Candidatus Thermoplasmatota archaeon]|nr:hypothetical protein [Candidatus Thermoplasmatota archaeon]
MTAKPPAFPTAALALMAAPQQTYTPPPPPQQWAPAPKPRPLGVTILGVLYLLGGALMALAGLAFVAGGAAMSAAFAPFLPLPGALLGAALAVVGIVVLGIGVLSIVVGKGLLDARPWAWTVALVLTAIGLLMGVLNLVTGNVGAIVNVAISGFIVWYLYQDGVKAWFGQGHMATPWAR